MTGPINIGGTFRRNGVVYEVVGTKPGGKVELFVRAECRFVDRWHREVKGWERLPA